MFSSVKRGQAAAGAAVLLAIIAGVLIMFILNLQPADRAELLGEDVAGSTSTSGTTDVDEIEKAVLDKNLLLQNPGRIDFLAQKELEHPLPVVNLFIETGSEILAEKNLAQASRSLFSEHPTEFKFVIADLEHTDNVFLSFTVNALVGRLIVYLNGEEVYNGDARVGPITPIALPKNALQRENVILFAASSPGVAFWRTNEASVDTIKVIGDVTNLEAQASKHIFLVSETEARNLEKVILRFQPDCKISEVGPLSVYVNGNEIYNAVPDCDLAFVPIEFSPGLVKQGENEIVFRTERGVYLLSHVVVTSKLKEIDFPTYYFDLSQEQYESIKDGERRLRLTLNFVDVVSSKFGDIVFNGHAISFDTKEVQYVVDVSEDVVRGSNALKIKPRKTLEIRELRVDLVK